MEELKVYLEKLEVYSRSEKYVVRFSRVNDSLFFYAHINGEECNVKPYRKASEAIEWAENETTK